MSVIKSQNSKLFIKVLEMILKILIIFFKTLYPFFHMSTDRGLFF